MLWNKSKVSRSKVFKKQSLFQIQRKLILFKNRNVSGDKIDHRIGFVHYLPCINWKYHFWQLLLQFHSRFRRTGWFLFHVCVLGTVKVGVFPIIIVHQTVYRTSRELSVGDILFLSVNYEISPLANWLFRTVSCKPTVSSLRLRCMFSCIDRFYCFYWKYAC